jgi:hypothetical protein
MNVKTSTRKSTRYFYHILMKLELSRRIFEKSSNIKFNQNPSSGRRVVLCGRTERQQSLFALLRRRLKIKTTSKSKSRVSNSSGARTCMPAARLSFVAFNGRHSTSETRNFIGIDYHAVDVYPNSRFDCTSTDLSVYYPTPKINRLY